MQLLGAFQPSQLARARSDAKSSVVSDWRRAGKPITRLSEDVMDQLAQEPISEEKGSRPMLEVKWRLKACLHLDFSDAMFKLETFMPDDFVWGGLSGPGGGGGKATARSASKDAAETTMPVWKLISLDLSNNEIGDGDFVPDDPIKPKRALTGKTFVSLERLTLTHNKLEFPIIFMPTLKELNLSNNRIYRFPILAGLRKLEVLDLSHNVIEKLDETDFEDVEDLKDLDVSDNHIEIMPSELDLVLQRLGNLALSQVKLEENPFCLWFAEYQTLAVRHLSKKKTIQRLDDLNFELEPTLLNEMIEDSRNYFGDFQNEGARSKMLEKLDKEIKQRQCKKEKLDELEKTRKYKAMEGNVQVSRLSKHSHFEDVVQEMREATMHPNNMKAWVVLAFDLASKVMKDWMETGQSIFRLAAGTSQRSKTRDIEESRLVAEFSTLVMQIARASEESRSVLIRLIGKLCPAPSENLRDTCMSVLARIMQDEQTGGQEIRREAIRMLKETVIPLLEASGMEVDVGANVVKCLHTFLTITDAWEDNAIPLRQDIAIALRQVMPLLCGMLALEVRKLQLHDTKYDGVSSTKRDKRKEAITAMVRCGMSNSQVASQMDFVVIENDVLVPLTALITNHDQLESDELPPAMFRDWVKILQACVRSFPDEAVRVLMHNKVHLHLFGQKVDGENQQGALVPDFLEGKRAREDALNFRTSMRLAAIFDFVGTFLDTAREATVRATLWLQLLGPPVVDTETFREAGATPLMTALLWVPSWWVGDPMVLAASLRCLLVVLMDPDYMIRYLPLVSDRLGLCNKKEADHKVFPYVTSKFKDLLKKCQHMLEEDPIQREQAPAMRSLPTTTTLDASRVSRTAFSSAHQSGSFDWKQLKNPYALEVLCAVIRFIAFFAGYAKGIEDKDEATFKKVQKIDEVMNDLGRDSKMMDMLNVQDPAVREAVAHCMKNIDVNQMSEDEKRVLLEIMDTEALDPDEAVLCAIISQLQHFIEAENKEGDKFRAEWGGKVLELVCNKVLLRNFKQPPPDTEAEARRNTELRAECVKLMLAASHRDTLRPHLRTPSMEASLQEALKLEDDESSKHEFADSQQDICIELTWLGRHVNVLLGALKDLHVHQKRSFRVIARVADVLECCADPHVSTQPPSAEERAMREVQMFDTAALKRQVMSCAVSDDDAEERRYEDYTLQHQLFVQFHGLQKILNFLEKGAKAFRTEVEHHAGKAEVQSAHILATDVGPRFQDVENCEAFLKKLHAHADEEENAANDRKSAQRGDVEAEIKLDVGTIFEHSREQLVLEGCMVEGWKDGLRADEMSSVRLNSTVINIAPQLRSTRPFYLPGMPDRRLLEPTYSICAFLRAVHAVLVAPALEQFRTQLIAALRVLNMQLKLLALIEQLQTLTCCNVAAKYLRIMSIVLAPGPGQAVVTDSAVIMGLELTTKFVGRCMALLRPLLMGLGRGYALTLEQTVLCRECIRMLSCTLSTLPKVELAPNLYEVQRSCTQKLVQHIMPMKVVVEVCLALLYDMQLDLGSADGRYINSQFVKNSLARQGIREYGLDVLARISEIRSQSGYYILEFFNCAEVVGKCRLRASFFQELTTRMKSQSNAGVVERHLQAVKRDAHEKVLARADAELRRSTRSKSFSVFTGSTQFEHGAIILTTKRVCFVGPPRGTRCGLCPDHTYCSLSPTLEVDRPYSDLTRIIIGEDQQTLTLGWQTKSVAGNATGETFDIFICHRNDIRAKLVETLASLSGPTPPQRLLPVKDNLLKLAIAKRTTPPVVCVAFAYRVLGKEERMSLFVLTQLEFCEFRVEFDGWKPPFNNVPAQEEGENYLAEGEGREVHLDRAAMERWAQRAKPQPTPIEVLLARPPGEAAKPEGFGATAPRVDSRMDSRAHAQKPQGVTLWDEYSEEGIAQMVVNRERAVKATKLKEEDHGHGPADKKEQMAILKALTGIFTQHVFVDLTQLQQVEFHAECDPTLGLTFKSRTGREEDVVVIRFLDDLARERWRRGLSMVLSGRLRQWLRQ